MGPMGQKEGLMMIEAVDPANKARFKILSVASNGCIVEMKDCREFMVVSFNTGEEKKKENKEEKR